MPEKIQKWIFYDSLSKTQSNPITSEEAQMAIFKMRIQDAGRFFIWTAGWENWLNLKTYLESKQKNFVSSFSNPHQADDTVKASIRDVLEMKPADEKIEKSITKSFSMIHLNEDTMTKSNHAINTQEFDFDKIKLDTVEKPNHDFKKLNVKTVLNNRADRHELKIEVLLISAKGKTFRSKSKNISLTGSLLEDNVPFDYCGTHFDVVVINTQPTDPQFQRVSIRGKTVGEGLTQRIFFIEMTPKQKMTLQKLLENYLDAQKKLSKVS